MNNNHATKDVSRKGHFIDVKGTIAFYLFLWSCLHGKWNIQKFSLTLNYLSLVLEGIILGQMLSYEIVYKYILEYILYILDFINIYTYILDLIFSKNIPKYLLNEKI